MFKPGWIRLLLSTFALLTVASIALADAPKKPLDVCVARGSIAHDIQDMKMKGYPLAAVKQNIYEWITGPMDEMTPTDANVIKGWYNDWTGEVMEEWLERVYITHMETAQEAYDSQLQQCQKTNNKAPR